MRKNVIQFIFAVKREEKETECVKNEEWVREREGREREGGRGERGEVG